MSKLLETIGKLPEDQKRNFSKFMGVMASCEKQIDEKLHFADLNGFELTTLLGAIRYLEMDLSAIEERFDVYKQAGYEDVVTKSPELICLNPHTILERISICEKVGKPFRVDGKYASFLFDDKLWKTVENALEENDIAETSLSDYEAIDPYEWTNADDDKEADNIVYSAISNPEPVSFDESTYDTYLEAIQIIKGVKEALGTTPVKDVVSLPIAEDELITKLLKAKPTLDAKSVAKYCLQYCDGLVDGIDPIIDAIASSMKEEKRGL